MTLAELLVGLAVWALVTIFVIELCGRQYRVHAIVVGAIAAVAALATF